jgi:hypothetical protein
LGPEGRICQNYSDLIGAFIERRHALGLSQGDVDYISGLQEGYTGKIESYRHQKSGRVLGVLTLPLLLQALGVELVVKPIASHKVPSHKVLRKRNGKVRLLAPRLHWAKTRSPVTKRRRQRSARVRPAALPAPEPSNGAAVASG